MLGNYANYILLSYGATIFLIVGLLAYSVKQQKDVRKQIKELEQKK